MKYIGTIYETESSYVFVEVLENGHVPCCGGNKAIKKETGEIWIFAPMLHIEEWKARKEYEIPEEYRYPGEID